MKTINQIKKEIEEYTKGNTCGEFNIKIRELQALLDFSNEIIEKIDKRIKKSTERMEFCKKHSKKSGDYNDNEVFRALSVYDELKELKQSIIGSKEKND
jgi:hypothetical protein